MLTLTFSRKKSGGKFAKIKQLQTMTKSPLFLIPSTMVKGTFNEELIALSDILRKNTWKSSHET